ncbi:hypothetical protein SDC9_145728 [bioreactor metagenome]|uniref:Uncharacterized protein n=1 Tax=bioreactor metagenome TaxID=1076179 RepID=A0A645E9Q9_9ZZZZ
MSRAHCNRIARDRRAAVRRRSGEGDGGLCVARCRRTDRRRAGCDGHGHSIIARGGSAAAGISRRVGYAGQVQNNCVGSRVDICRGKRRSPSNTAVRRADCRQRAVRDGQVIIGKARHRLGEGDGHRGRLSGIKGGLGHRYRSRRSRIVNRIRLAG